MAEYLIEEVLSHQAPEVQTFLLQTSILERLNASLCERRSHAAGCGQVVLDSLRRLNLFVNPMDDEGQWFRYHRLFTDPAPGRGCAWSQRQKGSRCCIRAPRTGTNKPA